jgi:polyhydroxybutyrate depolymerase
MKKTIHLFLILLFTGINALSAQTTLSKTMQFGGISRTYRLYIPASYHAGTPAPLVLNLHGYTSNNTQQEFYGDFRPIADTAGFILIHPNGTPDMSNNLYWNAGFSAAGPDDTGFLVALIDSVSATYSISQDRIYTTGMSNGGIMSYYLACHSNRFAAIASVTGTMTRPNYAQCTPSKPTPVMEIHGTADATVPYIGSSTFIPIDSVVRYWATFNHCNATPAVSNVPNINLTDGATAIRSIYSGGTNGVTVEHYKITGGAHTWPGAPVTIGVTCMDFSASKEIWRFFNQYRLTAVDNPSQNNERFAVSPNPVHDFLQINTDQDTKATIEIVDLQGKIIQTQAFVGSSEQISVQNLPNGFYMLHIFTERETFRTKFIKN